MSVGAGCVTEYSSTVTSMSDKRLLARAASQRVVHSPDRDGFELTVHDDNHKPSWRRAGARGRGEITFRAEVEDGVPILVVRLVEIHTPRHQREEVRETTFEVIGSSAIETFEAMRSVFDQAQPPRGDI